MAGAMYSVTAFRPVGPNWENRGRDVQQYELRVKRLDITFGERISRLFEAATKGGVWKDTAAAVSPEEYWARGVIAYFEAVSIPDALNGMIRKVSSRDNLKKRDPALYDLVNETMAYEGHVDWHLGR
jgi:hypothetical protein